MHVKRPKTYFLRKEDAPTEAYVMDAEGKVLGRVAVRAAQLLMGKHRANFTPHVDGADVVVVLNAQKVRVTGHKEKDKTYFSHSGYPRGDKLIPLWRLLESHPDRVIKFAVSGMLPKNRLRDRRLQRLKVFAGNEHTLSHLKMLEVKV